MTARPSTSLRSRAFGAIGSTLVMASVLLTPGAALAAGGPGTPPILVNDTITTTEETPASGNVLANDSNPGTGTLVLTSFVALDPSIGVLTIAANGDYTYTPAANFFGTTTTTYNAANDKHERTATITITVNNTEDPPTANDDTVTVSEDTATDVTAQLLGNDTDPDNDTLAVTGVSNVTGGGNVGFSAGAVTYTPDGNACGSDLAEFDYAISDGNGGTDTAHATVDVTCVDDAPAAGDDSASGTEDTEIAIAASDLTANDTDAEGDTLTVTGVSNASGGSVSLDSGTITFTPDANLCGTGAASFDYTVDDGNGGSDTGHVTIDLTCVNENPVANDDTASGTEDTDVSIAAGDLTANDTDADNDTLTVTAVSNASGGAVALDSGTVTFSPDADACGTGEGSFDYTVDDGNGGTDTGHVTIDLACVNDDPVANDDTVTVDEDTGTDVTAAILANDTDAEGDTLAASAVSNASGGTADVTGGVVTFTPDAEVCGDGAGSFDYTVEDGNGGSDTGHVTVDVTCKNDAPVANDDTATVDEDTATDVTATILSNDTDADGDTLAVSDVSNATGGTVDLTGGVVPFDPDADACGTGKGSFDYSVDDGNGGTDTGHVTVDVTCENDNPVATDDTASGTEDGGVSIDAGDLASNDTDADGDTLTVTAVSNPTGGTAGLDSGTVTFTPDDNLCGIAAAGFDYTVDDGNGGTDTGHVAIDLTCVNDAPVAGDDTKTVDEDTATDVTAGLLDNDTDTEGDTLSVTGASGATGGTVDLTAGVVTFTPAADACGTAEGGFDYTIDDGNGGTDTGHVTVDVTCENDAPVAVDDGASGTQDADVVISGDTLAANDTDADTDTLSVTNVANPSGGTVDLTTGTVTFTPTAGLCGLDAAGFDYPVDDGNGGTDTGHVTIDLTCVGPTNNPPVAVDDVASVAENSPAASHDVLANDTDADGDTLSLVSANVASSAGTVSIVAGMVRYTPKANFHGIATITYVVTDGADSDTGTLTVTVVGDTTKPVVKGVTVQFASGRVDETAPLKLTWSATDLSGIKGYQVGVSIRGGAFKQIYAGTGTTITKFFPLNAVLVFRVRATDNKGNTSSYVISAKRSMVGYQNLSRFIAYTGTWHQINAPTNSGAGYAWASSLGNRAQLTFTGRAVLYVAPKMSNSGYVKLYIDGKLIGRYNLHSSTTKVGNIIARWSWAAGGSHTIRVVNDQSGTHANFDAFIVLK